MKRSDHLIVNIAVAFVVSPFFLRDGLSFQLGAFPHRTTLDGKYVSVIGKSRLGTQTGDVEAQHEDPLSWFHEGRIDQPLSSLPLESPGANMKQLRKRLFVTNKSARVLRGLLSWFSRAKQWLFTSSMISRRRIRNTFASFALLCLIHSSALAPAWAAGSSGRMGGSYGSSGRVYSSPSRMGGSYGSSGRVYSSPRSSSLYQSPAIHHYYTHHLFSNSHHHHRPEHRIPKRRHQLRDKELVTTGAPTSGITATATHRSETSVSVSQLLLVAGTASLVTYRIGNSFNDPDTPLGPGASIVSLTACLNVPDRNDPTNILCRLQRLADTADTGSRRGLQRLMANTALALLRQDEAVVSAEAHYEHMASATEAERRFNFVSTRQRSKFDRESRINFGGEIQEPADDTSDGSSSSHAAACATMAIVCINLAIEGDSLRESFSGIKRRKAFSEALTKLSSDVQVEDCLLSAEVIWSPEDRSDQLRLEDVYSDFPALYTLLD